MLPLSLSYDHRVIDGAEAARFVKFVCELALRRKAHLALIVHSLSVRFRSLEQFCN